MIQKSLLLLVTLFVNHILSDILREENQGPVVDYQVSSSVRHPESKSWLFECQYCKRIQIVIEQVHFPGQCSEMSLQYRIVKSESFSEACNDGDVKKLESMKDVKTYLELVFRSNDKVSLVDNNFVGKISLIGDPALISINMTDEYFPHVYLESTTLPQHSVDMPKIGKRAFNFQSNGLPGEALCSQEANRTNLEIKSPLYPSRSAGGSCNGYLTVTSPRSSAIMILNLELVNGDFIAFQDPTGIIRYDGPLQKIQSFGLMWPIRFIYYSTNKLTNSRFLVSMQHLKQPDPCHTVINVQEKSFVISNPAGPNGKIPPGIFCEIRIIVQGSNHVQIRFNALILGRHEVIQVQTNGPELIPGENVIRFDRCSRDTGMTIDSVKNVISVYVITKLDSENIGEFQLIAEKKSFD